MLALPPLRPRPAAPRGQPQPPKKFLRRNVALVSRSVEAAGADRSVRPWATRTHTCTRASRAAHRRGGWRKSARIVSFIAGGAASRAGRGRRRALQVRLHQMQIEAGGAGGGLWHAKDGTADLFWRPAVGGPFENHPGYDESLRIFVLLPIPNYDND